MLTISANYYFHIVKILEDMGANRSDIQLMTSVDLAKETHPSVRIAADDLFTLLRGASDLLDIPDIGLQISNRFRISTYGRLGNVLGFCKDIEEAYVLTRRYYCLVHTLGSPQLISALGNPIFHWVPNYSAADDLKYQQITEFIMANYILSLNWLAWGFGQGVRKVTFKHTPTAPISTYHKTLNCTVEFEAENNAIYLHKDILNRPLPTANSLKLTSIQQNLERVLASYNLTSNLALQVEHKVREIMESRQPTLPLVAHELSLTERTLKRHLKKQELNFQTIVKSVKMDLCESYIQENIPYSEIAQQLWYCDQSAFTRAFKKWHGVTPTQRAEA